jgi:hypothetical protein
MMRRSEFLRPLNNVPQRLVLASMGVMKGGFYGPQKLFQLADGRSLYLDLEVAQRLEQIVSIGQEFWLCKRKPAGKGQKRRWDIYLQDPMPQDGESDLERDLRLSIQEVRDPNGKSSSIELEAAPPKPPEAPAGDPIPVAEESPTPERPTRENAPPIELVKKTPSWASTLVNHTNELIDAYTKCMHHANQYGVAVKSDDVRTLLVTTFINLCQRNGRKGAA